MLDQVIGEKRNPLAADELLKQFRGSDFTGTLYIGYPVLASLDEPIFIDALLTTLEHGVVAFDLDSLSSETLVLSDLQSKQDDIHAALQQKLMQSRELRDGRQLAVPIAVVTLSPSLDRIVASERVLAAPPQRVLEVIRECKGMTAAQLQAVNASIQRVTTIKPPRKRISATRPNSRGSIIKEIEKQIANLDRWQKAAAIELPDGPQRIRGLAGSGKTVVLALKAAYLHVRNPDWRIVVTFNTRSLYQQFRDLVRRFTFDHTKDEPDWTKLQVLHAWGSPKQPGVYSEVAAAHGLEPRTFLYAKQQYGYDDAFAGVCQEVVDGLTKGTVTPLFDAILIDEAQDLPHAFFEMAFIATKSPKRIVFAYDELQNLSSYAMAPPSELFGKHASGEPRVATLQNEAGAARRDIVLPVCYRNTPWALTVAHALGFGIYRDDQLVQFFDDPELWQEIGYE